jgi:gamma-glutamylaminecyclotransferase
VKIFVYGSLRKGFYNHRLLTDSTFLGMAKTPPGYTMIGLGGFPGVIKAGEGRVLGEIYEVSEKTLKNLDRLESHPNFYCRTPVEVETPEGEAIEVETYLLPISYLRDGAEVIESGDWKRGTL